MRWPPREREECKKRAVSEDDAASPPLETCHDETDPAPIVVLRVPPQVGGRSPQFPYKKPKPTLDEFIFHCLACRKENCPYENGYTVLDDNDGQQYEYDPGDISCEVYKDLVKETGLCFDKIRAPVKAVAACIVTSEGFWAKYKFIGSQGIDHKLKAFMKTRVKNNDCVDKNWYPLRRSVKEALRYRRQLAVENIHSAYIGASCFLVFSCRGNYLKSIHLLISLFFCFPNY